ncbi:MAG: N-acetyltransferase [Planctomycetota bacterium]
MKIRKARISDAKVIHSLITSYAEREIMLFRSLADIYENIQTFIVAEVDGNVIGCCALDVIWEDLAEIKSLAVDQNHIKSGIGKKLVAVAAENALEIGLPRIFALTLNPAFFKGFGFTKVEKQKLPMKVWKDCAKCSKQKRCDEIAVLKKL